MIDTIARGNCTWLAKANNLLLRGGSCQFHIAIRFLSSWFHVFDGLYGQYYLGNLILRKTKK